MNEKHVHGGTKMYIIYNKIQYTITKCIRHSVICRAVKCKMQQQQKRVYSLPLIIKGKENRCDLQFLHGLTVQQFPT